MKLLTSMRNTVMAALDGIGGIPYEDVRYVIGTHTAGGLFIPDQDTREARGIQDHMNRNNGGMNTESDNAYGALPSAVGGMGGMSGGDSGTQQAYVIHQLSPLIEWIWRIVTVVVGTGMMYLNMQTNLAMSRLELKIEQQRMSDMKDHPGWKDIERIERQLEELRSVANGPGRTQVR